MSAEIKRLPNETIEEFGMRISINKDDYNLTWQEVAALLNKENGKNVGESSYRKYYIPFTDGYVYAKRVLSQQQNDINTSNKIIMMNKDGSQTSEAKVEVDDENKLRNPEYLLELHNYNPREWEIVSSRNSFWDAQVKDEGIKTLYSSKITVKPRKDKWTIKEIDKYLETKEFKNIREKYIPTNYDKNGEILEITLPDLHSGLLSHSEETTEDYNIEIAKKNFYNCLNDILERIKDRKFYKIYFVPLGDVLHIDSIHKTTTKRNISGLRW